MATRTDGPLIVRGGGLEGGDAAKAEKLRFEITQKRNDMGRTVDAIEERLSPKNIKAQVTSVKDHLLEEIRDAKSHVKDGVSEGVSAAKQRVRDATVGRVENMVHDVRHTVSDAGSTTIDTVKTNPIPAALVAVGLGWLIVSGMKSGGGGVRRDNRIRARSRDQWYGYREGGPYEGIDEDGYAYAYRHEQADLSEGSDAPRRVLRKGQRVAEGVGHKAQDVAERAKSVASETQHKVADKAEHLVSDARSVARNAGQKGRRVVRRAGAQARRAEQGFERQLRDNPLAFGAVAVAIGAAIGLLLPNTEVEDRLMGAKKDRLLDTAKDKAQSAAQQALSTVQDKAGGIAEKAGGLAQQAGSMADKLGGKSEESSGYANGLSNGISNGISSGPSSRNL